MDRTPTLGKGLGFIGFRVEPGLLLGTSAFLHTKQPQSKLLIPRPEDPGLGLRV